MIRISYIIVFAVCFFSGCKEEETLEASKEPLHKRFNGKYEVLDSWSNKDVDINLDGKASSDMRQELPNLAYAYLELRILLNEPYNLFTVWWPEQYLSEGSNLGVPNVNFATQGVGLTFNFSEGQKKITLDTSQVSAATSERFVIPLDIKVLANDIFEISFNKKVYTSTGWRDIIVTTRYRRWTNHT